MSAASGPSLNDISIKQLKSQDSFPGRWSYIFETHETFHKIKEIINYGGRFPIASSNIGTEHIPSKIQKTWFFYFYDPKVKFDALNFEHSYFLFSTKHVEESWCEIYDVERAGATAGTGAAGAAAVAGNPHAKTKYAFSFICSEIPKKLGVKNVWLGVNLENPGYDKLIRYYQRTGFSLDSDVEKKRPFSKPKAPIYNHNRSSPLGHFFSFRYSSLVFNTSELNILTPCNSFELNDSSNVYTINVDIGAGLVNHIYTKWVKDAPNEYAFILSGQVAIPGTDARGEVQLKWNLNGSFSMPVTEASETSSIYNYEHSIESPSFNSIAMNNISCHTHPLRLYAKFEQDLSPPSDTDIQIMLNYATGKYEKKIKYAKHLVWTVEGVYKIVINPNINKPTVIPTLTSEDIAGIEANWSKYNYLLNGINENRYLRIKAFIDFLHNEKFSNGRNYSDYFNIIFYRYIPNYGKSYSLDEIAFDSQNPCTEFVRTTSEKNSFIKNPKSITTLSPNELKRLDEAHTRYKTILEPITKAQIDFWEGKDPKELAAAIETLKIAPARDAGGGPAGAGAPAGGAGASSADPTENNLNMGRTTGGNRKINRKLNRHTKRAKHQSKRSRRISRRH